jgi:histidyl-tRNA synthetase
MAHKPSLPKGTRDFNPLEVARRNHIISVVKKHFVLSGFGPIETPSFENYETLMGKYGEEGDRLVFKILNSGDFLSKITPDQYTTPNAQSWTPLLSEKALRYDLTVPFARYVVMHQNELTMPFKRYQIQPVWRADRPQKGRYREFYQCDADVVGSDSLFQEIELIQLYDAVFSELGLSGARLKMNNRKVLTGIAEVIGAPELLIPFTVALDKLDKIGQEAVVQEMLAQGIGKESIERARPLFEISGHSDEVLVQLERFLASSEVGLQGVAELRFVLEGINQVNLSVLDIEVEVTLARGLNYYTGMIFEVAAPASVGIGSIGGGGRYDDLTAIFGLSGISGVGVSFGLDRIYLVMEALALFPDTIVSRPSVLFAHFGEREAMACLPVIQSLRSLGVSCELYPSAAKMQKQIKYADQRSIPWVVLIGSQEMEQQIAVVKHMADGAQVSLPWSELPEWLQAQER